MALHLHAQGPRAEPMLGSLETYAGSMSTYRRRSDTLGMPRHKRAIIRDGARSNTTIILTTCSGSYGEMRMVKIGRVGRASRAGVNAASSRSYYLPRPVQLVHLPVPRNSTTDNDCSWRSSGQKWATLWSSWFPRSRRQPNSPKLLVIG